MIRMKRVSGLLHGTGTASRVIQNSREETKEGEKKKLRRHSCGGECGRPVVPGLAKQLGGKGLIRNP